MQIPKKEFTDRTHNWQEEVLREFDSHKHRFFMLNWHRRARKTTLALNILIREACRNKRKRYAYIGPTYRQSKKIIWKDPNMLNIYLPEKMLKIKNGKPQKNESELYCEFSTDSILEILGSDRPDTIRGEDFEGVVLDEWALQKQEVWQEIIRPIITQNKTRWAIFPFTPKGRNHVYDYWKKAPYWAEWHTSFLPVSTSQLLPESELEQARKEMPESMYLQEYECSFLADEEFTLIPAKMVEALRDVTVHPKETRRIISCDPGLTGDECVIMALEDGHILDMIRMQTRDTMKVAGTIATMMAKYSTSYTAIDVIGIGKGIVDRLREMGKRVIPIDSREKALNEKRFYNKRAEMWWTTMELIRDKKVPYMEDFELRRQLSFVRYTVVDSNGKIKLEPKKETKDRLGRSPDEADAYIYGITAMQRLEPEKATDKWQDEWHSDEVTTRVDSAMTA